MGKHVYFVRHGESDSNADGILRGKASQLTENGRTQAAFVAERIAKIGVDALVSSDFPRALDTAGAIAERTGLAITESNLFVETRPPSVIDVKHKDDEEVRQALEEEHAGHDTPGYRHSDEENFEEMKARAFAALKFLEEHSAERICVVTHGFFLRMLLSAIVMGEEASGKDFRYTLEAFATSNTGVTHAVYTDRHPRRKGGPSWVVVTWNDSAHLG